ncbi:MAG: double-strand break repair protein AddB [Pseudomonadota bacterium]
MFEPTSSPRVFGLAPGVDFPAALVKGLLARLEDTPPEALARVQIIVNTSRMERRLKTLFDDGPARLIPRIHLLTHLDALAPSIVSPPAVPALQRRLELIALVSRLIDSQPELAPRTSLYALTDSLAALIDEMQGEGVSAQAISSLDVSDQSGHWQRTQSFIRIAQDYLSATATQPDKEARQRAHVCKLADHWATNPPQTPIILAGSTGSRGTTMLLMQAVARLPQGALVLPGFDFDMPPAVWQNLDDPLLSEDHPQYRFHKLLKKLDIVEARVAPWSHDTPPAAARNALVSLSLRPAPVTHAWRGEGPKLGDLRPAVAGLTLVEAPTPRAEAVTIALRLRKAAQDGQTAALISPDRMLTRQVTAALDKWGILPDDSAGMPLHLSPPGRFLRHVAGLFQKPLDAEALLTLLKHPLTHSAGDRGAHVLNTQRLELAIRDKGLPYPDAASLRHLMAATVAKSEDQAAVDVWTNWMVQTFTAQYSTTDRDLADWVKLHVGTAEAIARGALGADSGELWLKNAGLSAHAVISNLQEHARHGGTMSAGDYAGLVGALLAEGEVRDRDAPHPGVMIWGTLEARVQGADLVILGGLNDGTWPEAPAPDPWLNRSLRNAAGLLLPERRIGLAAHDYQQAVAAPEVWITRAVRSDDSETVAARWINRLTNLMKGLTAGHGPEALDAMRARGADWLARAEKYEAVGEPAPAPRPSPRPPADARPRDFVVTDIKHLIRDPYAIYARRVLRLNPLGPLMQSADALARGTVLHQVLEDFVLATKDQPDAITVESFLQIATDILQQSVPWPTARALWQARLGRSAPWFIAREQQRRMTAAPVALEAGAKGKLEWSDIAVSLRGRADRIDRTNKNTLRLYDYKTGRAPSTKEQAAFDKQLLIEAAMIEEGAFAGVGAQKVDAAVYIGLGAQHEVQAPLETELPARVLTQLRALITAYLSEDQGFTARRRMQKLRHGSDYDLLSRFGEWDETHEPVAERLT